ncbi:hypothetical protein IEQ44_00420 [Nocardioides sp. Y6]|uniref:DUF5060 domain-containing protein n=1 Tax=Nocardioides malaquae TaxID=2773426 RepID=A0ABR9RNG4_9ACTN|nr:hypothetical protein [Nocardioides malaquae]MBE7323113.1 hypothetical protein [Nocardioides malaquae]
MTRLTDANLIRRPDEVVLSWTVEGDLEATSTPWLLSFDVIGGPDGPSHQFGFRFRGGKVEERFYFDYVARMNYYVDHVTPQRVGNKWTAVFPAGDEVASAGKWTAVLAFDEPHNANESHVEGTF